MRLAEDSELSRVLQQTLAGMREFCADGQADYDDSHVGECERLVALCLDEMTAAESTEEGLAAVRRAVEALNLLNERCEHQLIETAQREGLCAVLCRAGFLRSFNGPNDDPTEDWRDW